MGEQRLIPLAFLSPGESGLIREIRGLRHHIEGNGTAVGAKRPHRSFRGRHLFTPDRGHRMEHRLRSMGLCPGVKITMIRNDPPGPVIVGVNGARICVGRGIALKLMVEKA